MMRKLLRRMLARLQVAPFEGRWTPQVIEQSILESEPIGTDPRG